MITVTQIRNGERYFSNHLTANDYYSESESITGFWQGEGASRLSLSGDVTEAQFEAIRCNQNPRTGEKLTPRKPKVVFHDVVVSAPKALSIAAMVGDDDRLLNAFRESVEVTFGNLEKLAAVRDRKGAKVKGEDHQITGNAVCATFIHDTSRLLDPQVHAHLVFGNVTYSKGAEQWLALQPRQMMEATKSGIRKEFYQDLASRIQKLGYEVRWRAEGFGIVGISDELEQKFSRRSLQRRQFEERYQRLFGEVPSKGRIEHFIKEGKAAAKSRFRSEFENRFKRLPTRNEEAEFVRDFRSSSMKTSSREEVRKYQRGLLDEGELGNLRRVVEGARTRYAAMAPAAEMPLQHSAEASVETSDCFRTTLSRQDGSKMDARMELRATHLRADRKVPASLRVALGRAAALRRIKRGQDLTKAMKGYPMGIIAKQLRRNASQYR